MENPRLIEAQRFPEIAYPTNIDPMKRQRRKPMEVICIGMMRTGTMSMKHAFERLGYDGVYHMVSCMQNPQDATLWRDAFLHKYQGKGKPFTREDWDHLLGDSQVCIDVPPAAFMPELIAAYPEAKIIISERDPDKWYASLMATVGSSSAIPPLHIKLLTLLDSQLLRPWTEMLITMTVGMFGPQGYAQPAENIKKVYIDLHEEVRRLVPEERRLEYKLGMGWGPLCEFLGKEKPAGEFPHLNESDEFLARVKYMRRTVAKRVALEYASYFGVVTIVAMGWVAWTRRS